MKVLQVPFCFYPDPVGGTEVYVGSLATELARMGVQAIVVAPGKETTAYPHSGLAVRRFSVSDEIRDIRELYGEGDPQAAEEFSRILGEERPDIVHLHAFTRGVSLLLVREARRRGIPVVFTYHTPTASCQRGTLMRWGTEVCDGLLREGLCARCTLHGLGVPRGVADLGGSIPARWIGALGRLGLSGGVWTALRMRELVALRHATFRALMAEVDHVIVLCRWTKDLLIRNGVPTAKLTLVRHGFSRTDVVSKARHPQSAVRVAALGRMDPTKGFHILIRAIRGLASANVQLDIYGVTQGETGERYARHLQRLAAGDSRIRIVRELPAEERISRLREYDLVAVPSQLLETGPLVVLEAFAAGIPVLGSRLGGIAELVRDGVGGLLVERFSSPAAWADQLRRLSEDRKFLERLRKGIRPPRTMETVAGEMKRLYERIISPPPIFQGRPEG